MKVHSIARALVLGLALAGTALPVQAQDFQFRFGFGDRMHRPVVCIELTDRQVRNRIAAQGYSNIYLNARDSRRVQSRATRGNWVYLLEVSTCTGRILDRQRLRRA